MPTLVIGPTTIEDPDILAKAAEERGWEVVRIYRKFVTPAFKAIKDPVIWSPSEYAEFIAKELNVDLVRIHKRWLPMMPYHLAKRKIVLAPLKAIETVAFPCFIKPPIEKGFKAQVYNSIEDFGKELKEINLEEEILIQEPVEWEVEYRVYMLDEQPLTWAPYKRDGKTNKSEFRDEEIEEFKEFIKTLVKDYFVPEVCVLDVGKIKNKGWAVVEANGAYGSGIYKCDPDKVLDVLEKATIA